MPTMILGNESDLKLDKIADELEKVYDRGLKGFRTAAARLCVNVVHHLIFEQGVSIKKLILLEEIGSDCSEDLHRQYDDEGDIFCRYCGVKL